MSRYEYSDDKSNKFWEIELGGSSHTVRYGRIGTDGQTKTKEFADRAAAEKDYDKMTASKVKKGYALASGAAPPAATKPAAATANTELEEAILANPTDDAAWAVYGDWLQTQGDPRGELAAVQLALASSPSSSAGEQLAREQAILKEHGEALYPTKLRQQIEAHETQRPAKSGNNLTMSAWDSDGAKAMWHAGFIRSLKLARGNPDDCPHSLIDLVKATLGHPSVRLLAELTIGALGECEEYDYNEVTAEVAGHVFTNLRSLEIADFLSEQSELSWSRLGDLGPIWKNTPRLEKLHANGGSFDLGTMDLPKLREFLLYTAGLSADAIRSVLGASWPALEKLDLMFGADEYGAEGSVELIAPLLSGERFAAVRHLGLMNSEFADSLAEALPGAAISKQLESLDLSLGTMTKKGALLLAAGASSFTNLKSLSVDDNYIDNQAEAALKTAFPFINIGGQEKLDEYEEEEDWRYVRVGE